MWGRLNGTMWRHTDLQWRRVIGPWTQWRHRTLTARSYRPAASLPRGQLVNRRARTRPVIKTILMTINRSQTSNLEPRACVGRPTWPTTACLFCMSVASGQHLTSTPVVRRTTRLYSHQRLNRIDCTGATPAEKLDRTSRGVDADPLPFLLRPFPVSRYCSTHFHKFPSLYFSFLLPLNLARMSVEALQ